MRFSVVITVNKNDLWFCRICVASIRYFYPDVTIYLLKDELNGFFSTRELEKNWNVQLIEFGIKKFGWSGAKMHFYTDERFVDQRFLVIDCDIVLVGRLLNLGFLQEFPEDVIVNEDRHGSAVTDFFTQTYFDFNKIIKEDPSYVFPGYAFNCGQMFCKGNFLTKAALAPYFDFTKAHGWKRADLFPLVDQSLFNYLFPRLSSRGKLTVGRKKYMIWGGHEDKVAEIDLRKMKLGNEYPALIHWAGTLRTPLLSQMTGAPILTFFQEYYYSKVTFGSLKSKLRTVRPFAINKLRNFKKKVKLSSRRK